MSNYKIVYAESPMDLQHEVDSFLEKTPGSWKPLGPPVAGFWMNPSEITLYSWTQTFVREYKA